MGRFWHSWTSGRIGFCLHNLDTYTVSHNEMLIVENYVKLSLMNSGEARRNSCICGIWKMQI